MSIVNSKEIRRRRTQLGLTQARAAKLAGWGSPVVWTDIESGKRKNPSIGTLVAVANVLECKVDELLTKNSDGVPDSKTKKRNGLKRKQTGDKGPK